MVITTIVIISQTTVAPITSYYLNGTNVESTPRIPLKCTIKFIQNIKIIVVTDVMTLSLKLQQ